MCGWGGGLNRNCQGFLRSLCVHIDSWCMCLYCLPPTICQFIHHNLLFKKNLNELSLYMCKSKYIVRCTLLQK
jgi:hypothetical protein